MKVFKLSTSYSEAATPSQNDDNVVSLFGNMTVASARSNDPKSAGDQCQSEQRLVRSVSYWWIPGEYLSMELCLTPWGRDVVRANGWGNFFSGRRLSVQVGSRVYQGSELRVKLLGDSFSIVVHLENRDRIFEKVSLEETRSVPTWRDPRRVVFVRWNGPGCDLEKYPYFPGLTEPVLTSDEIGVA